MADLKSGVFRTVFALAASHTSHTRCATMAYANRASPAKPPRPSHPRAPASPHPQAMTRMSLSLSASRITHRCVGTTLNLSSLNLAWDRMTWGHCGEDRKGATTTRPTPSRSPRTPARPSIAQPHRTHHPSLRTTCWTASPTHTYAVSGTPGLPGWPALISLNPLVIWFGWRWRNKGGGGGVSMRDSVLLLVSLWGG